MKIMPYFLVAASILSGAVYGWYREGMPRPGRKGRPQPIRGVETPALPGVEIAPEPETAAEPGPASLLSRADSLFEDLDFAGANAAYGEAARAGGGSRAARAKRRELLSDIFERAIRRVPRTLAADAPHEVTLANDRVLIGRVTTDPMGNVTLRTDQGISATFKPHEIASVRRVETATWRASQEAELQRRLSRVGRKLPPALDYFQAAYFCIRNGLADRAADLLVKSSESEGFEMVIETFGGEESDRLMARWEKAIRRTPVTAGATGDNVLRAEELYQEGLRRYRKSWPGMNNAEKELKEARALFEGAQSAFERAKQSRPDDRWLDRRLQSVQTYIYDCIKRATL